MKLNYMPKGQFNVTFYGGVVSDTFDIPADGLAFVCSPSGKSSVVVTFDDRLYEGPLKCETLHDIVPKNTVVSGQKPTDEEIAEIMARDDEEDDDLNAPDDDDDDDDDQGDDDDDDPDSYDSADFDDPDADTVQDLEIEIDANNMDA